MKISSLFTSSEPIFSFEFFPPKDEATAGSLMETIETLKSLRPDFVSVTYGAGGSTRTKTIELVGKIKNEIGLEPMAHLTCVGHSRHEVRDTLNQLADRGIENILALRGDPPKGETHFKPHPDGFRYANELVAEIASMRTFCIGAAGYPEKHIEAPSLETDLINLKRKVDAGAAFVTTQLFFTNEFYFDFVARARAAGIRVPIIPGIMPITNFAQIQRFATLCGTTLSTALVHELEAAQHDPAAVTRIGINHALQQCRQLLDRGAPGIHFYTLNRSHATREVLDNLRSFRQTRKPLLGDI